MSYSRAPCLPYVCPVYIPQPMLYTGTCAALVRVWCSSLGLCVPWCLCPSAVPCHTVLPHAVALCCHMPHCAAPCHTALPHATLRCITLHTCGSTAMPHATLCCPMPHCAAIFHTLCCLMPPHCAALSTHCAGPYLHTVLPYSTHCAGPYRHTVLPRTTLGCHMPHAAALCHPTVLPHAATLYCPMLPHMWQHCPEPPHCAALCCHTAL